MELQIGSREALPQIMLARYYGNASTLRFLGADPDPGSVKDDLPQSWNRYAYANNNPIRFNDPTGEDGNDVANWVDRQVNAAVTSVDSNTRGSAAAVALNAAVGTVGDIVTGAADLLRVGAATGEAMGSGAEGTDFAAAVNQDVVRATGLFVAIGGAAAGALEGATSTTVVHYTDDAGRAAIGESGNLRAGTYVTKPSEIPKGATAGQIESKLEVAPGKGQNSITTKTPRSNLQTPANGPKTSGGAKQSQLKTNTKIDRNKFKKTGG